MSNCNSILQMTEDWWVQPTDVVIKACSTDLENGLVAETVKEHRKKFGTNIVAEIKPTSALELILDGVREPMMVVLLAIAGLSLFLVKSRKLS